jgi:CRISPR-associated protein Cas2
MLFYLVVYDISDDKRRGKVAGILEGYGRRVQYSVFECVLPDHKYVELKGRLKKFFRDGEDSIRFYPVSKHTLSQVDVWGAIPITKPPGSIII